MNLEELESELRTRLAGQRRERRVVAWIVALALLTVLVALGLYALLA